MSVPGMAAISTRPAAPQPWRVAWARLRIRHPEWWACLAAATAWVVLLAPAVGGRLDGDPGATAPGLHHGHQVAGSGDGGGSPADGSIGDAAAAGAAWLLMVVAMMLPVLVPRMRRVGSSVVGRSRDRAVAETVLGAGLVWAGVGVLAVAASFLPVVDRDAPVAFLAVWSLAVLWQLTPGKWVAMRRGHDVRVPRGEHDGRARVVAGARHGGWCLAACGPAMAAMVVTGHGLALMATATLGFLVEGTVHRSTQVLRRVAVALGAVAVLSALTPLGG